jgi:hypothetical protein
LALGGLGGVTEAFGQRYDANNNVYLYEGADLPNYFIVQAFFINSSEWAANPNRPDYEDFLKTVGITKGSASDIAFRTAIADAKTLHDKRLSVIPYLNNPVAYEKAQDEYSLDQVTTLRSIYRKMLSVWEGDKSISMIAFQSYLQKIRGSLMVGSTGAPAVKYMMIVKQFDLEPLQK